MPSCLAPSLCHEVPPPGGPHPRHRVIARGPRGWGAFSYPPSLLRRACVVPPTGNRVPAIFGLPLRGPPENPNCHLAGGISRQLSSCRLPLLSALSSALSLSNGRTSWVYRRGRPHVECSANNQETPGPRAAFPRTIVRRGLRGAIATRSRSCRSSGPRPPRRYGLSLARASACFVCFRALQAALSSPWVLEEY